MEIETGRWRCSFSLDVLFSRVMEPGDTIGDFELVRPLGEGGMGTVWVASHSHTGESVALKLLRSTRGDGTSGFAAFRAEVEAIARCRHPNIIRILDYGGEETSPWFAMERVDGGDLGDHRPQDWDALRLLLNDILDGLAHAHARNIIHRDLKPANVLVGARYKLTDFGLAHRATARHRTERQLFTSAGTPYYMAPEQFLGRWRMFGPWTDLYALGCMTFQLVSDSPPFVGRTPVAVAQKHLTEPVPALRPRFGVPAGLIEWITTLMEKEPLRRLATVAEARSLLNDLGAPVAPSADVASEVPVSADDSTMVFVRQPPPAWPSRSGEPQPASVRVSFPAEFAPGQPRAWGLERESTRLFSLRPTPLVGHDKEVQRLWQLLREADDAREARVVVVRGPQGSPTGRIARAVAMSAHKLVGARFFRATHDDPPAEQNGLSGMLRSNLRLGGLEPDAAVEHLRELLRAYDVEHLTEAVAAVTGFVDGPDFVGPLMMGLVRRLVALASRGRPGIMVLEDVDRSTRSLEFARGVANTPDRFEAPLLVICTCDELARSAELSALLDQEAVPIIDLSPVPAHILEDAMCAELKLDRDLAGRIAEASGGFSEYAFQIVGNLVQQEALIPGRHGLESKPGATAEVPHSIRSLWRDHVRRIALDDRDLRQLGLAVLLGPNVDWTEWAKTSALLDLEPPAALTDRLVRLGLGRRVGSNVQLRYQPFGSAVLQLVDERGLLGALHATIASYLSGRSKDAAAEIRLAYHELAGGAAQSALDRACAVLEEALENRHRLLNELTGALMVAGEATAKGARAGAKQRRLIEVGLACEDRNHGRPEAALQRLERFEYGDDDLSVRARLLTSAALQQTGDLAAAAAELETALSLARLRTRRSQCLRALATICIRRGRLDDTERWTRKALALLDPETEPVPVAWCHYRLANASRRRGDLREAEDQFAEARRYFHRGGYEIGLAETHNGLAEVQRARGEFGVAMELYDEAYRMMRDAGSRWSVTPLLNRAITAVLAGRASEIAPEVEDLLERLERKQFVLFQVLGLLVSAAVKADCDDRRSFDAIIEEVDPLVTRMQENEPDVDVLIEWIEARWRERHDEARAARMRQLRDAYRAV